MSNHIERIQYIKAGEDRVLLIDPNSRRMISDSAARTAEARAASWRKSDRILKDELMTSLPGVVEFREEKNLELQAFLKSEPSIVDLMNFSERVRMEAFEFFDSLANAEARGELSKERRQKRDPKDRLTLSKFFDMKSPCDFEGCEKLRSEWLEAYEEAGGDECTSCQLGDLRRQFEARVLELTNAKSG